MAKSGPIVIVEDDIDDQEIIEDVMTDLGIINQRIYFSKADEAFVYLKNTIDQPFIIFSDVNIPIINGLEFKKMIDNDPELRQKAIPFVFFSTSVDQYSVNMAYTKMTVQGFFKKNSTIPALKKDISLILDYWSCCKHPNSD